MDDTPDFRDAAIAKLLSLLWAEVIDERDDIERRVFSKAEERLLEAGASREDLIDAIRSRQVQLLGTVCMILDNDFLPAEGSAEFDWRLMAAPAGTSSWTAIPGLHDEFHQADPSGHEGQDREGPHPVFMKGAPLFVRQAVADSLSGDHRRALNGWREATGLNLVEAQAALKQALWDYASRN